MNTDSYEFLSHISPIDGRYHSKTQELNNYFSEMSFNKYRIHIEIQYLLSLCELGCFEHLSSETKTHLLSIVSNFPKKNV